MSEALTSLEPGRLPAEAAGARVAVLYERHGRSVYGLCRLLLRDSHEAEDAAQATFLAAHKAIVRGAEPREPGAWLAAIARNECRGRIRERMREPVSAGAGALVGLEAPGGDPSERIVDPAVARALASLSDRQREAVVLHDAFGLRAREVAAALGLSLPAVEALLFRARRQLRMRLEPVSGALALPIGLRDALAQAIPGFSDPATAAGAATAGAAGAGLFAKLAGAPAAAKIAAATVAVTAAGSAAVVSTERATDTRLVPAGVETDGERRGSPVAGLTDGGSFVRSGAGADDDSDRLSRDDDSDGSSSGPGGSGDGSAGDDDRGGGDGGRDPDTTTTSTKGSGESGPAPAGEEPPGVDDDGGTGAESDGSGTTGSSGPGPVAGEPPDGDEPEIEDGGTSSSGSSSGSGSGSSGSGSGDDDLELESDGSGSGSSGSGSSSGDD